MCAINLNMDFTNRNEHYPEFSKKDLFENINFPHATISQNGNLNRRKEDLTESKNPESNTSEFPYKKILKALMIKSLSDIYTTTNKTNRSHFSWNDDMEFDPQDVSHEFEYHKNIINTVDDIYVFQDYLQILFTLILPSEKQKTLYRKIFFSQLQDLKFTHMLRKYYRIDNINIPPLNSDSSKRKFESNSTSITFPYENSYPNDNFTPKIFPFAARKQELLRISKRFQDEILSKNNSCDQSNTPAAKFRSEDNSDDNLEDPSIKSNHINLKVSQSEIFQPENELPIQTSNGLHLNHAFSKSKYNNQNHSKKFKSSISNSTLNEENKTQNEEKISIDTDEEIRSNLIEPTPRVLKFTPDDKRPPGGERNLSSKSVSNDREGVPRSSHPSSRNKKSKKRAMSFRFYMNVTFEQSSFTWVADMNGEVRSFLIKKYGWEKANRYAVNSIKTWRDALPDSEKELYINKENNIIDQLSKICIDTKENQSYHSSNHFQSIPDSDTFMKSDLNIDEERKTVHNFQNPNSEARDQLNACTDKSSEHNINTKNLDLNSHESQTDISEHSNNLNIAQDKSIA